MPCLFYPLCPHGLCSIELSLSTPSLAFCPQVTVPGIPSVGLLNHFQPPGLPCPPLPVSPAALSTRDREDADVLLGTTLRSAWCLEANAGDILEGVQEEILIQQQAMPFSLP